MSGEPIIVFVQGGCVTDVLGVPNWNVMDWDDFDSDPIGYWDDHGSSGSEYWSTIEDAAPELYAEIEQAVQKEIKRREAETQRDPFWMVPA